MKRLTTAALAVLTVLVMVFSLTACGGKTVTLTVHDKDAKTESAKTDDDYFGDLMALLNKNGH